MKRELLDFENVGYYLQIPRAVSGRTSFKDEWKEAEF
jgi:hypothetical protein